MRSHPGAIVKDDRRAADLSLSGLAGMMEEHGKEIPDFKAPSITTLSRIESGEIAKPSVVILRAIASALGKEADHYVLLFRQFGGDGLNIIAAHTIFGAAAFASLPDAKIDGLNLGHFGTSSSDGFVPEFSSLSPNGNRRIKIGVLPDEEPEEGLSREHAVGDSTVAVRDMRYGVGWNAFCLGEDLKSLWEAKQVDAVIASRDLFQAEFQTSGPMEALACANLTRSVRGVSLVALVHPTLAIQHSQRIGLEMATQVQLWLRNFVALVAFARSGVKQSNHPVYPARIWTSRGEEILPHTYHINPERVLEVLYPKGTFAEEHVRKLCASVDFPWGTPRARELLVHTSPRDTCQSIKTHIEETNQNSGVAVLAVWEPYTSHFRHQWDRLMENTDRQSFLEVNRHAKSCCDGPAGVVPDYSCSTEISLGRFLGSLGVQAMPNISMDLIVRKSILNDLNPKKNQKLATLVRFLRVLTDTSIKLKSRAVAFATEFDTQTSVVEQNTSLQQSTFRKSMETIEDTKILNLANVLRIPRWRALRAISELDLSVRYDPGFLELFLPDQ